MKQNNRQINRWRVRGGPYASKNAYGNNGLFLIPLGEYKLAVLASDGGGWEHISVSVLGLVHPRCPVWEEMCLIKDMFWDKDETVIQYHPAEADYVNMHPHTLHLWKPVGVELPTPPSIMVGVKS